MNENLPTPPVETEEDTQQTTQQIQESLDYRDLLSSQIMAEQAKANASKYVMGGLQASGAAQTGLAQSVLSGIQSNYQNTLAQNMNQFSMTQDIRQAEQLSQTQTGAINTATTLLSEPDLTQDEYEYIYNTYYSQMSPQDQQTFKFLYDRKGRELGFLDETGETTTNQNIDNFFRTNKITYRDKVVDSTAILSKYESFQNLLGRPADEQTIKDLYTQDKQIFEVLTTDFNNTTTKLSDLEDYTAQEFSDMFIRMASSTIGSRNDAGYFADDMVESLLFGKPKGSGQPNSVKYDWGSGELGIKDSGLKPSVRGALIRMGFTKNLAGDLVLNKSQFEGGNINYNFGTGANEGGELRAQIYAKFLYTLIQNINQ